MRVLGKEGSTSSMYLVCEDVSLLGAAQRTLTLPIPGSAVPAVASVPRCLLKEGAAVGPCM